MRASSWRNVTRSCPRGGAPLAPRAKHGSVEAEAGACPGDRIQVAPSASAVTSSARRVSGDSASIRRRYAHSADGGSDRSRGAPPARCGGVRPRAISSSASGCHGPLDDALHHGGRQLGAEPRESRLRRAPGQAPRGAVPRRPAARSDSVATTSAIPSIHRRRAMKGIASPDASSSRCASRRSPGSASPRRRGEDVQRTRVDRVRSTGRAGESPPIAAASAAERAAGSERAARAAAGTAAQPPRTVAPLGVGAAHPHDRVAGSARRIVEQRRLPRAGLAADDDDRAPSLARRRQRALEPRPLFVAPDQGARRLGHRRIPPCAGRAPCLRGCRGPGRSRANVRRAGARSPASAARRRRSRRGRPGPIPLRGAPRTFPPFPGTLQPRFEVLARRLEMALNAVCDPPDPDRLVLIARRPGQADRPRRQGEVVGMPLAHVQVRRQAAEHRVAPRGRRQEDLVDPQLGLRPRDSCARRTPTRGLRPEAHAEVRLPGKHGLPNGLLLRPDPGTLVVVPDVHPGTHDDEEVVPSPIRDRLALVHHDPVDASPRPSSTCYRHQIGSGRRCSSARARSRSPVYRALGPPGDASPTGRQKCRPRRPVGRPFLEDAAATSTSTSTSSLVATQALQSGAVHAARAVRSGCRGRAPAR